VSASGDELKMMEPADPVAVSGVVTNSLVETAGSAFSSVGNVSGAGETCCGFSSTAEAELSTGRWLSTRAMSLFGCGECSSSIADSRGDGISSRPGVLRDVLWSGSSERLSDSVFFCEGGETFFVLLELRAAIPA
jgi:hypothetical protein